MNEDKINIYESYEWAIKTIHLVKKESNIFIWKQLLIHLNKIEKYYYYPSLRPNFLSSILHQCYRSYLQAHPFPLLQILEKIKLRLIESLKAEGTFSLTGELNDYELIKAFLSSSDITMEDMDNLIKMITLYPLYIFLIFLINILVFLLHS